MPGHISKVLVTSSYEKIRSWYITMDPEMRASQNGFGFNDISLNKKTNIIQNMAKNKL